MLINALMTAQFRGAGRIRALIRGAAPVSLGWGRSKDNLSLALDPANFIDGFIIREGYYEREVLDAVLENLPENGVFWDVGANIGLHALTIKALRPDVTVVAFEPAPFTVSRLMLNVRSNKLDIQTFAMALGAEPGYANLAVSLAGNCGLSSLEPWSGVVYEGNVKCRVERADDLVKCGAAPPPSVMKIDVEGFEPQVLSGAAGLLSGSGLRAVVLESDGLHLESISRMLNGAGFIIHPLTQANRRESVHSTPNYLAKRS